MTSAGARSRVTHESGVEIPPGWNSSNASTSLDAVLSGAVRDAPVLRWCVTSSRIDWCFVFACIRVCFLSGRGCAFLALWCQFLRSIFLVLMGFRAKLVNSWELALKLLHVLCVEAASAQLTFDFRLKKAVSFCEKRHANLTAISNNPS